MTKEEEEEIIKKIEKDLRKIVIPRKCDRRIGEEKPVEDNEEEYLDDEYIDSENDPETVEKITEEEDYTIPIDDVKIEFDEVLEIVKTKISNLTNYDKMMQEKVLDSLRRGTLK